MNPAINTPQKGGNQYRAYYTEALEQSEDFRDYITERLARVGIVLNNICSRQGQFRGENLFGLEIKYDRKFASTGNLCIEVGEKACPRDGDYAPSGIYRDDNSWLLGIGDYDRFFILQRSLLRSCFKSGSAAGSQLRQYRTETSIGFLLPVAAARKIAGREFSFANGDVSIVNGGVEEDALDYIIPYPHRKPQH